MNLILLCDYGLDDAVATVALLKNKDMFERFDILAVGGNVPERAAFDNAVRLLSVYEGDKSNVQLVDTSEIEQPAEYLADIHGGDGMGSLFELPPSSDVPIVKFCDWIKTVSGEDSIVVSLGPCTVTEIIMQRIGKCPLLLMGGHVKAEPNYKGFEFNYGINPPAFAACFKYPHTVATLDTCHIDRLDFYKENPMSDPLMRIMVDKIRELDKKRGFELTCVYDYIAVCSLIYPERYTVKTVTDPFGNVINQLEYVSDEPLVV
ncbi:MAG: nucleoside hydrolase [Clostridia bacterium]|nr:nucleoside hydrolase [Clostridia bacterium]